jgi:hypothetical protein
MDEPVPDDRNSSDVDESDSEDLIRPEPLVALGSERMELMDREEERLAADSDDDIEL